MFTKASVWFIPHGSSTVVVTVGGINSKLAKEKHKIVERDHLCLALPFDHDMVDGATACRFTHQFIHKLK